MDYSDYIVYVDESGDHGLKSIDPMYPVFVLACCIFSKSGYVGQVVPLVQDFKFRFFGHDLVILHGHEIRKQKPPFAFLQNEAKRQEFMEALGAVIEAAPFTLIASVINKENLRRQYLYPDSPYDIALTFCMERTYAFLRSKGQHTQRMHFVVERRGEQEDKDLELAFRRVRDGANQWGPMPGFDIVFADKKMNSTGLQLADLVGQPIGRHILKPDQSNRAYEIIEHKFRRGPSGKLMGWGLKIFP